MSRERRVIWDNVKLKPSKGNTTTPKTRGIDWGELGQQEPKGKELLKQIGDAIGGGATGLFQGGSDIGANIAQFPSDAYTYFTGKEGYHAPKPDFRQMGPQSDIGQKFEKGGEFLAPFASPAMAGEALLGKAMYGGRFLPRLLTDMLGAAAESDTGHREVGAALGAGAPLFGKAAKYVRETPFTKFGATKNLNKAKELAGTESLNIPPDFEFLKSLDYLTGMSHLKPNKMQINQLIGETAKGDYPSYFNLQSALGDISRELQYPSPQKGKGFLGMLGQYLSPPQTSASERLTGHQLENLRQQYIKHVAEHLTKTGKGKIPKLEAKGREDYSRYKKYIPMRNKAILGAAATLPGIGYLKHFLGGE